MVDGKLIADREGRSYAKLSEVKAGDILETDEGFTCVPKGTHLVMKHPQLGYFINCTKGQHYIDGQADDGETLIGMYHVTKNGGT